MVYAKNKLDYIKQNVLMDFESFTLSKETSKADLRNIN
jgi:hypothetical protein